LPSPSAGREHSGGDHGGSGVISHSRGVPLGSGSGLFSIEPANGCCLNFFGYSSAAPT